MTKAITRKQSSKLIAILLRRCEISAIIPVIAALLLGLSGCAKNECYECIPAGNIPGQETVKLCQKGMDLDVQLSYYRNSGYTCSKVSGSSRNIVTPDDPDQSQTVSTSAKSVNDGGNVCGCPR